MFLLALYLTVICAMQVIRVWKKAPVNLAAWLMLLKWVAATLAALALSIARIVEIFTP